MPKAVEANEEGPVESQSEFASLANRVEVIALEAHWQNTEYDGRRGQLSGRPETGSQSAGRRGVREAA